MLRTRLLGAAFVAALIFASNPVARAEPVPGNRLVAAAFCCAFEFQIRNQTRYGADVKLSRTLSRHIERVSRWIDAGQTIRVKMGAETYYDLEAIFRKGGTGSAKVGEASVHWHLHQGSSARLIESNGRYSWTG